MLVHPRSVTNPPAKPFLLAYTLILWVPVLIAGGYALYWSAFSGDSASYRPVLGVIGALMLLGALSGLTRGVRTWTEQQRQSEQ